MVCSNCGTDNRKKSLYCNKCGTALTDVEEIVDKPYSNINKKYLSMGFAILGVGIILFIGILSFNNPVSAFKKNIESNNSSEAMEIYNDKITGNEEKEDNVNDFLIEEITSVQKLFYEEELDFKNAKTKLETIGNTQLVSGEVDTAIEKINNLNDSRLAYKKAEEHLDDKDLVNVVKEFKNVIKDDQNYRKAQEKIEKNEKQYKKQVIKNAEELVEAQNYEKALEIIKEALNIMPNDADLTAKEAIYLKAKENKLAADRKQVMEDLKARQELEVINNKVVPDYFSINDQAQVVVRNNTQKVIKNFTLGILMYDNNGFPLKSGILAGENELFKGKAEAVNIQPGKTFGDNSAWNLYTDFGTVKKVSACVLSVEYYDGSSWTNDYYRYWEEDLLGKPLN